MDVRNISAICLRQRVVQTDPPIGKQDHAITILPEVGLGCPE